MAEEKGTGKHPHKSTQEPWPHQKNEGSEEAKQSAEAESSQSGEQEQSSDLEEREYRDEHGNVHHHTRTSEAMKERKAS